MNRLTFFIQCGIAGIIAATAGVSDLLAEVSQKTSGRSAEEMKTQANDKA